MFCPYHSFPEDHECKGLHLDESNKSKTRNYEVSAITSKRKIVIACVILTILVLSMAAVVYAAPELGSVLGKLNSYNENPVNITSETSSTSIVSSTSLSNQYASSSLGTQFVSTTSTSTTRQQQEVIDSSWVLSFISVVNAVRDQQGLANLTYAGVLSQFAQIRFNTMVSNYEISHYGYDADFQQYLAGGTLLEIEEVLFPAGFSPSAFMSNLQTEAPIHYGALFGNSLVKYGYYLANGPAYEVQQPCPATEIPGPNINITQYYDQNGCQFTIVNSTWFVLELST